MVGPEKIFKMEVLRWMEDAIFRLDFANTVIHKRAMLPLLCRMYKKHVRHSFVTRISYGPTLVGPGENFQNECFQKAGKCYFKICFCNTVNASFNYTFFQLMYRYYVALNSSETA